MTSTRIALLLGLLAALLAVTWVVLFRHTTYDNPALGIVTTEYRWGKARFVLLDANRDGRTDSRALYSRADYSSPHDVPSDLWESTQCNGRFDLHGVFSSTGVLLVVELDGDGDGEYDVRVAGERAQVAWEEARKRRSCFPCTTPP